jgi:hypothetical protein
VLFGSASAAFNGRQPFEHLGLGNRLQRLLVTLLIDNLADFNPFFFSQRLVAVTGSNFRVVFRS